jgi:PAS domain S-box-containing protein
MSVTLFLQRPSFPLPVREELPSLRHFFKRLWLICIGAAALLLLSFVVMESIETHLEQRRGGVVVAVNLLGRQRMHSQMLVRLAMQSEHGRTDLRQHSLEQMKQVWSVMSANQAMLQSGELLHAPRARLLAMQEKLAKADGSFTSLEKTVQKIIARLDGLGETDTQLPDSLEEALLTECDAFAEALDKVADEIVVIDADTSASLKLVGWLRIAVSGVIALTAVFLLTRGQVSTLKRLIDTSMRFEELTYLQNAVLESTAYSIISTTPEGMIVTFNRGAENLTGYSRDEMVGVHTPLLIHDSAEVARVAAEVSAELEAHIAPGFEVLAAPARRGVVREREWTYVKKDGERVPVSLSMTAMWSPEGNLSGFLAVAGDISEKKKLEQQFLRAPAHRKHRHPGRRDRARSQQRAHAHSHVDRAAAAHQHQRTGP